MSVLFQARIRGCEKINTEVPSINGLTSFPSMLLKAQATDLPLAFLVLNKTAVNQICKCSEQSEGRSLGLDTITRIWSVF